MYSGLPWLMNTVLNSSPSSFSAERFASGGAVQGALPYSDPDLAQQDPERVAGEKETVLFP